MKLENAFGRPPVLMCHVYYGDPDEEFSLDQIKVLAGSGADILEIGIPFTDPSSDGKAFQRACARALDGGMTPGAVMNGIRKIRSSGIEKPVVLTSYYNIIFRMGEDDFVERIRAAGANGLIVPDLPFEEAGPLRRRAREHGLELIQLVTPNMPLRRLDTVLEEAGGFVYLVSIRGVTGGRMGQQRELEGIISKIRERTSIPVLVGFGISTPAQVEGAVRAGAQGVIIGSALAGIYEPVLGLAPICGKEGTVPLECGHGTSLERIGAFVRSMKSTGKAPPEEHAQYKVIV